MATVARPPIFPYLSLSSFPVNPTPKTLLLILPTVRPSHRISKTIITRAGEGGYSGGDGDFGARDPFPAEIESNFGDKVLGFKDTEHKILIPNIAALSLATLQCQPVSHLQPPLSDKDANSLLRKVVGWRLSNEGGGIRLQCLWRVRDFKSGVELINRICKAVEDAGHLPNLYLEQPNQVRAELWTASIGGLSMNDFIVAAKIDEIQTSDLVTRKRVWA